MTDATEHPDPPACWLALLGQSLRAEHDYSARIDGRLPDALQGTLYRNGPGLFQRGTVTKRHLLDGDGMIQAFTFANGSVRYRNRFVRTPKFLEEDVLGQFVRPTWSTRSPAGLLRNMGGRITSQAGVTVYHRDGRLLAFDEVGLPFELDPATLETRGEFNPGPDHERLNYKAHTRVDGRNGDWVLLSVEHGPRMVLNLVVRSAQGIVKSHQRIPAPRQVYIHDWFLTARHVLVMLQPLELSLPAFLMGQSSFIESLRWKPEKGTVWLLIDRDGVKLPVQFESPARFMWHVANAWEEGDTLVADAVTYDEPDHFIGEEAALRQIMLGNHKGRAQAKGEVWRHTLTPTARRIQTQVISSENHEFPVVAPHVVGNPYSLAYFTTAAQSGVFHNGLARIHMHTGERHCVFIENTCLGEPVLVPDSPGSEEGWLLSLGLDGASGQAFLGVFRSDALSDGPVARAWLQHPTPLSFHGEWVGNPA